MGVLKNVRLFTGGADLTSRNNKLEINCEVEAKPTTNWGDYDAATGQLWESVTGGLFKTTLSAEGQWEAGDPGQVDDVSWADLGGLSAWTACPHTAEVGALSLTTSALRGSYQLGGSTGDVAPWSAGATGSWPEARGVILHPPGTARTATGSGTAVEHLAVTSAQYLYGAVHVLSVAGTSSPTITVKIQSDVDNTFGSPTDLITFTAATARTGEIKRAAGPVTDTWYRATWTVSGSSPSFLFLVALGIA